MKANFPAHAIHTDLWQDSVPGTDFLGFVLISSSSAPCSPPRCRPLAVPCLFSPILCSSPCAHSRGACMASPRAFPQSHQLLLNIHPATPPGPPPQPVCSSAGCTMLLPPKAARCVCEPARGCQQPSNGGAVPFPCFQPRGRWGMTPVKELLGLLVVIALIAAGFQGERGSRPRCLEGKESVLQCISAKYIDK